MAAPAAGDRVDLLERVSRALTLLAAVLALAASLAAPLLAISWSHRAFPGFLVEPTLVVNNTGGTGWGGEQTALHPPQHIARVAGQPVSTARQYDAVIAGLAPGQHASFFVTFPDGSARLYPSVLLDDFPQQDLLHLFWLPYLAGIAYLGIGLWVYRAKGATRPGRALAFFCFATAIASGLSFDLATTHALADLWTISIAMMGGALISLALRFPQEWQPVGRRSWLLAVPYLVSMALAALALDALHDPQDPWRIMNAWDKSYLYAVAGVIVFLSVTLFRAITGRSNIVRRQARLVLLGGILAFVPITAWFAATAFGLRFPLDAPLLLPILILFPLSTAIAIFRYRLLEVDHVVNRAILYGTLTAVLAGLYSISIMISQRLFVVVTGEQSDAAIVVTTLIVASAFAPVKDRLAKVLSSRFKDVPDSTRSLQSFSREVDSYLEMSDAVLLARRFLAEAAAGLRAESGAVSLVRDGRLQSAGTIGRWQGEAWIALPLEWDGRRCGLLWLGPRLGRQPYGRGEFETLQQAARPVAQALRLALHVHPEAEAALPASPAASVTAVPGPAPVVAGAPGPPPSPEKNPDTAQTDLAPVRA
jgi:hypothetical protein